MSDYRSFRANQNKPTGGDFTNNYSLPDKNDDEYTEEDLTQVKSQIRNVKQESANATRQAVARLAQTEDVAVNTMEKLGTQSGNLFIQYSSLTNIY
jgi:ribosomal protein L9